MYRRNTLEQWYEGKRPEFDLSECGFVNSSWYKQISLSDKCSSLFYYGESEGDYDLIDQICNIYSCKRENVLITNGASEALSILLLAICNNRSLITCLNPYYLDLSFFSEKFGYRLKYYNLEANQNFNFDFGKFCEAFCDESCIAILNFPNNPTSIELSDEDYNNIINYAENKNKIVIFDEGTAVSAHKTFIERNIHSCLNNCICINTMSKAYGLPGLRVGWIVASKAIIRECKMIKEIISICTSPLLQKVSCEILKQRQTLLSDYQRTIFQNTQSLVSYMNRFNRALEISRSSKNCSCCLIKLSPMFSDYNFCADLYNSFDVLLTPGSCFGLDGYLRLGLGIDPNIFNQALNRIEMFISNSEKN